MRSKHMEATLGKCDTACRYGYGYVYTIMAICGYESHSSNRENL